MLQLTFAIPIVALNCRYYNSEIHKAAFVLPQYAFDALKGSLTQFP